MEPLTPSEIESLEEHFKRTRMGISNRRPKFFSVPPGPLSSNSRGTSTQQAAANLAEGCGHGFHFHTLTKCSRPLFGFWEPRPPSAHGCRVQEETELHRYESCPAPLIWTAAPEVRGEQRSAGPKMMTDFVESCCDFDSNGLFSPLLFPGYNPVHLLS